MEHHAIASVGVCLGQLHLDLVHLWLYNLLAIKHSVMQVCVCLNLCTLQFSLIAQALLVATRLQMAHVPLRTVRSNPHPYSATPAVLL